MPEARPKAVSRRLPWVLAGLGLAAALAALAVYAARRSIVREALTAWLRSKGVEAAAEVEAIGPLGVSGSLVIGDPRRPDFTAERAEVGYGLSRRGLEVRSIRLVRPVLRARLHEGRFSAGALDPLIAELRKAPPRPGARRPKVTIEDGRLLLSTDAGPLQAEGGGVVAEGRLRSLAARVAPARLRNGRFDVALGAAALRVQAVGARVELSLDAPVAAAAAGPLTAANARLRVTAAGPYPDLERRRADGAAAAHVELSGGRLAWRGEALRNGLVSAAYQGRVAGGTEDLALTGRVVADVRAGGADVAGGTAGALHATASAEDLSWTPRNGGALGARAAASASLAGFTRPGAGLGQLGVTLRGPVRIARGRAEFRLAASASGHGAWQGLGAAGPGDSPEIAAVRRAARGFSFTAPGVALTSSGEGLDARLTRPARLLPDRGGAVTLTPAGRGFRLAAAGGGLPRLDASVSRFALAPGGAVARGSVRAALSIGVVRQGVFDASGELRLAGGEASFSGDRCARVSAARLELGANDVEGFSGSLCPAGGPLLSLGRREWRIAGRAQDVAGAAPFLQARLSGGSGVIELADTRPGGLHAAARLDRMEVSDAAAQTRFRPVGVSGEAGAAGGVWTSALQVRDGAGRPLARIGVRHEDRSGRGSAEVETGALRFAPGGLQPLELSPLAGAIGSPADGEARFSGRYAWGPAHRASLGVLEVPRLDFQSPVGKLSGLSGRIAFSSLAPLAAAPGQTLRAKGVATPVAPLTDLAAEFGLRSGALEVASGRAAVGGGLARVADLEVPLAPGQAVRGTLELEGVQLHDLVEASPFGDRVDLDARVSGRLPFTLQGDRLRIAGGALHAIQPGRLSIQRTALTGVRAEGAVSAPGAPARLAPQASADTFSDFAYQAMENLAFRTLTATLQSRPDGRLQVVFHIVGEHDPPQRQTIRVPIFDLLGKRFLRRNLPLPSGTGVNLTLDTSLNLDDLLSDYAEFRRLHGSARVQP